MISSRRNGFVRMSHCLTEVHNVPAHKYSPSTQSFRTSPQKSSRSAVQTRFYPLTTLLALTFLGLIANCTNAIELARWSENHLETLRPFLRFRRLKGKWRSPVNLTFSRLFEILSLEDLQHAFAEFINLLLADTTLVAAVDGKAAKQDPDCRKAIANSVTAILEHENVRVAWRRILCYTAT